MSKLTLTVDPDVIKQAKIYAASQQQSLSKLVENYLKTLPQTAVTDRATPELTGLVAELAGMLDHETCITKDSGYADFLQEKYK
ncbi:DUF6364 family protein [Endozoicomonas sp. Mp262]|uniref:DUF6364 family protein n=1 Tax=Endozoicomonas sp. Mp262 TaxID=2919499 RepID=UPI0021D81304